MVIGRGKTKACFATLAERMVGYHIVIKIPDRNGETMANAIIQALSCLPKKAVNTITCERVANFLIGEG